MKSTTFVGLIQTSDKGLVETQMTVVPMETVKEANRESSMYAGFKVVYGRTEKGEVFEFIKAGQWAKKDLIQMKELGIVELVSHGCFAPSNFQIPQGRVKVSRSFECGKETVGRLNRLARALA